MWLDIALVLVAVPGMIALYKIYDLDKTLWALHAGIKSDLINIKKENEVNAGAIKHYTAYNFKKHSDLELRVMRMEERLRLLAKAAEFQWVDTSTRQFKAHYQKIESARDEEGRDCDS